MISYVTLTRQQMDEMCRATIDGARWWRQKDIDNFFKKEMEVLNKEQTKKWFGDKSPYTFEQVKNIIENDPWDFELVFLKTRYTSHEELAIQYLNATPYFEEIKISVDDLNKLIALRVPKK